MAPKLCVQNRVELVGVWCGISSGRSSFNSELAELEGCNKESGGEFEV